MKQSLSLWLIALLLGAATIFVIADFSGGIGGFTPDWRWASLVALLALAIWIGPSLGSYRGRGGSALMHVAIWLGIAVFVALLYHFRTELGFG